jgi:hypothetical protein
VNIAEAARLLHREKLNRRPVQIPRRLRPNATWASLSASATAVHGSGGACDSLWRFQFGQHVDAENFRVTLAGLGQFYNLRDDDFR